MRHGQPKSTDCLFDHDAYLSEFTAEVVAIAPGAVALSRTCFYPIGGGQPRDCGVLNAQGEELIVTGARRDPEELRLIWLDYAGTERLLSLGDTLQGRIDWSCRHAHMRMHTCLHLLCSRIEVPVTSCGISAEKGWLDFDMPQASADKEEISEALNKLVAEDQPVRRYTIPAAETEFIERLTRTAAVAPLVLGGQISMIQIGEIDLQPCGGTHVASTAEIGPLRCCKIEKKGRQNRRISVVFA